MYMSPLARDVGNNHDNQYVVALLKVVVEGYSILQTVEECGFASYSSLNL